MAGLPGCRLRAWDHGVGVRAWWAAHMPALVPLVVSDRAALAASSRDTRRGLEPPDARVLWTHLLVFTTTRRIYIQLLNYPTRPRPGPRSRRIF